MQKPRKPQWRKKGESLSHFQQRQRRYVDRVIAYKEAQAKVKKRKR